MKNSTAPLRSWLSTSVSLPSWLFGKSWISSRPPVSALMRSAASCMRTFSGCVDRHVAGELVAELGSVRARDPQNRGRGDRRAEQRAAIEHCFPNRPSSATKLLRCHARALVVCSDHATRSPFLTCTARLSTAGSIFAGSRVTTRSITVGPLPPSPAPARRPTCPAPRRECRGSPAPRRRAHNSSRRDRTRDTRRRRTSGAAAP